jgi:integrase
MAAKVRKLRSSWYLVLHGGGIRKVRRYGSLARDRENAEQCARWYNGRLASGATVEEIACEMAAKTGGPADPSEAALPFDVYALEWLRTQVDLPIERKLETALSPATALLHERHVKLYLNPFLGPRDVRGLRVVDIQALYDHLLATGRPRSERSVEMVLATLRRILAYAEAREEIDRNPVEKWKRALGRKRRGNLAAEPEGDEMREESAASSPGNVLSWAELDALLAKARTDYPASSCFLLFLADTGARLGEASALRWVDVDLKRGVARIARSFSGGRYLAKTKTGRVRSVELSARLREALAAERPKIFGPKALVFPSETGGLLDPHNFRARVFRKLVAAVLGEDEDGKPTGRRFTIHGLRHSFASLHLARGTNLKWIQSQGGWASAKVLLDTYSHAIPCETTGYADAIAKAPRRQPAATEAESHDGAALAATPVELELQREIA